MNSLNDQKDNTHTLKAKFNHWTASQDAELTNLMDKYSIDEVNQVANILNKFICNEMK